MAAAVALAGRAAAATCGVLLAALLAFVVWRSAALLALLYVAALVALVLDRPVAALVRRGLARAWALALVLSVVGGATLGAGIVVAGPLVAQVRGLASAAPELATSLRAGLAGRLGDLLAGTPLATWVHDALPHGASAVAGGVFGAAGGVANAAGSLVSVLVMAVLLLVSGPDVVRRAIRAVPARHRTWAEALARDLSSSLAAYFSGLTTIVFARICATGAFLAIARVPFVIPLALLAGASVLIPYLGSVLRLVAIGAVAWESRGSGGALEALAFIAAYDLVENYVVSPLLYRKALGISALWQLLAVLFFGYHFGVVGAVLAIPLAATVQIVSRALLSPTTEPAAPPAPPSRRLLGRDRVAHGATPEAPVNPRSGG